MRLQVQRSSEVPLGVQLARQLRSHIESGQLAPGARLPSVREAAAAAEVNVNTVRSVYGRLEQEGLLQSVQGRGTFVAEPRKRPDDAEQRGELRAQIAALERQLSQRPPPASEAAPAARKLPARGRLLSTDELRSVRDRLVARLREVDAERAELLQQLRELRSADALAATGSPPAERGRQSTPSLAGARVRWVGT